MNSGVRQAGLLRPLRQARGVVRERRAGGHGRYSNWNSVCAPGWSSTIWCHECFSPRPARGAEVGVMLPTVAGRAGHSDGGRVTLATYAHWQRAPDRHARRAARRPLRRRDRQYRTDVIAWSLGPQPCGCASGPPNRATCVRCRAAHLRRDQRGHRRHCTRLDRARPVGYQDPGWVWDPTADPSPTLAGP